MAKRKRDPQDHDPAQGRGPKKVNEQSLEEPKKELVDSEARVLPSQKQTNQRQAEDDVTLARKVARRERRRLKKEQQVTLQAQLKSEGKEEGETGTVNLVTLQEGQEREEQQTKQKPKQNKLVSGEKDDQVNDAFPTVVHESNKPKRKTNPPEGKEQGPVIKPNGVGASHPKKQKQKNRNKNKNKPINGERRIEKSTWKISDPVGGRMLDVDPIFSRDENYLLVAYDTAITVYSTSTSLPVRRLRTNKPNRLSAFTLSSRKDSQVYISTITGEIESWDWTEGSRLGRWKLSSSIYSLTASDETAEESNNELFYTVDKKGAGQWLISAHRLESGDNATKTDVKTLLRHQDPLSSVKILACGRFVIATSGSQLIIGHTNKPNPPILQDLSYTWRIVDCPEWITCIDARISHPAKVEKPSKGGKRRFEALDIAIGGLKGSIHVYDNLLGKLIHTEQPMSKEVPEDIKSRRLHWHRNAVLSLKWSLDGNYLISGGQETVLVLWQLETGRRQTLPHLGAAIESIVVSPFGASYGIRLADNSAMILSTSELTPTFSIAGIQIPCARDDRILDLPFLPTVDAPWQRRTSGQKLRSPACIPSSRPACLLLAVPPATTSRQTSTATQSASYLQSFDITAAHQISKQALTRTKITDLNMGPESNIIEEPNVTNIQTSADGQWLATIDTWTPPQRDLEPLAFDRERLAEEQTFREEIHLKFWSWNEDTKAWELVSRIDNPHASQSGDPYEHGDVLQISSDPSSVGFATIGADGIVKTWKPAIRRRHGMDVRDKEGNNLTSWHCKHAILLESTKPSAQHSQPSARLTYSQDGSILVAGLQTCEPSPLYVLDTYSGGIRSIQTGLYNGPLFGLGVINKYLITLSNELCVWDLVNDELRFGIDLLQANNIMTDKRMASSHLAVDSQHGIFAIALLEKSSERKSQIAVFDPTNAAPLYQTSMPNTVTTLLPIAGRKGFYAIDSAAEVRTLVPSQSLPSLQLAPSKDEKPSSHGLRDIFGNGQSTRSVDGGVDKDVGLLTSKFETITQASRIRDDDAVVVSQDQLAEVFDVGPAYRPVTAMFEQVARLYNGRAVS